MKLEVRMNDHAWVRLTHQGKSVFWQHCDTRGIDPTTYASKKGYVRFEIFQLIEIFGYECTKMVKQAHYQELFENDVILLTEPN